MQPKSLDGIYGEKQMYTQGCSIEWDGPFSHPLSHPI